MPEPQSPSLVATHPDVEPLLDGRSGAQRARLLEAITSVVADRGYVAATVADVVREARVSRGTFYAEFASKEECFIESHRHGIDVLVGRIRAAVHAEPGDWRDKLRAGLRAYLQTLADEPRFARAHLLEIHAAGPRALAGRDAALRRFARRYAASFQHGIDDDPALAMPADDALFVLAAGVDQLVCAHVRSGGTRGLLELEEILFTTAVALFLGTAAALTTHDHGGS